MEPTGKTDAESDLTLSIKRTVLDYCGRDLPRIREDLESGKPFSIEGANWRLRQVVSALGWASLDFVREDDPRPIQAVRQSVAQLVELARKQSPGTNPVEPGPTMMALANVVEMQTRFVSVEIEKGNQVGSQRDYTLAAALAIVALKAGRPEIKDEAQRLAQAIDKVDHSWSARKQKRMPAP